MRKSCESCHGYGRREYEGYGTCTCEECGGTGYDLSEFIPALPESFGTLHDDGYWTLRNINSADFKDVHCQSLKNPNVYSAEQMREYAMEVLLSVVPLFKG